MRPLRPVIHKSMKTVLSEATRVFDSVIGFGRVTSSSLGENNGSVLFDVEGVGFDTSEPGDAGVSVDNSEIRSAQEVYSALGVVGRPPKSKPGDYPDMLLQTIHARVSDGSIPFAYRDPRILEWLNKGGAKTVPKEGQIALAGYGGSFISFETIDESNGPTNVCVLYCPYARDADGVPQKAHMIMLDPTGGNEAIAIVHASGLALTMDETNGITMRADAATWLTLQPGSFQVFAASIQLQGNVALGQNLATAAPLAAGPASAPTPSVFFSLV